jgi:hypothetical protein
MTKCYVISVEDLNYISQHRISNAYAEGFNSAIQLNKTNTRGFRNFTNYRARILFHYGKLDLDWAQEKNHSEINDEPKI